MKDLCQDTISFKTVLPTPLSFSKKISAINELPGLPRNLENKAVCFQIFDKDTTP